MMTYLLNIIIALLILQSVPLESNDQSIKRYQLKKLGEKHSSIINNTNDILIDGNGFAWIATDKGLLRFDGTHFFEFNSSIQDPFFHSSKIETMKLIGDYLYLANRNEGLISLNVNNFETDVLVHEGVSDFTVILDEKKFFVLTSKGTLQEFHEGNLIREINTEGQYGNIEYSNGSLYLAIKERGFYHLDRDTYELINLTETYNYKLPTGWKEQLLKTNDGNIVYVRFSQTTHISDSDFIDPKEEIVCPENNAYLLLERRLTSSLSGRSGVYFCDHDLYSYEKNHGYKIAKIDDSPSYIEFRSIESIDKGHFLTATNLGPMLIRGIPDQITQRTDDHLNFSVGPRIRRAIVETAEDELLLFGYPGLIKMSGYGNMELVYQEEDLIYYDAIRLGDSIYATTEGHGIIELSLNGNVLNREVMKQGDNRFHYSINELNEKQLIAGGLGNVKIINKDFSKKKDIQISSISEYITELDMILDIHLDNQNRGVWLASDSGLALFSHDMNRELQFYSNSELSAIRLINRSVTDILQSSSGDTLWIGGENGIDIIDINTQSTIDFIGNSVPNKRSKVAGLIKDNAGNIWASTYNGILFYDSKSGKTAEVKHHIGLLNREYNIKSIAFTKSGKVVLGGVQGYDIIDPEVIGNHYFSNVVHLSKLQLISSQSSVTKPIKLNILNESSTLSYRTDTEILKLYFSVLDLSHSNEYQLEYSLNNSTWFPLDYENTLTLNNLSYGVYKLVVRGKNPFGQTLENQLELVIEAKTPIYLRTWIYGALAVLFLLIIVAVLSYAIHLYKKDAILKNKISMDLHDIVGTNLTRTTLLLEDHIDPTNAVQSRILQNIKESNFTLRSFISTITANKVKSDEFIAEVNNTLVSLLENTGVRFKLRVKELHEKEYFFKSELVRDIQISLYELCTNTIKHSKADEITIILLLSKGIIKLDYQDNGDLKDLDKIKVSDGYGINNLKKRMSRYRGTLEMKISGKEHGLNIILTFKQGIND